MRQYDYIIIGSGIAGLYTALLAREQGSVLILTKGSIEECNTRFAQGGIAAAVGSGDSPQLHYEDTMTAGAGLSDPEAVRILTEEAPDRIHDLIRFGVPFDTLDGEVALTREAAHSVPRVLHAGGDATGEHIELTLSALARHSNIEIKEYHLATEIVIEDGVARGVRALDEVAATTREYEGRCIIVATGGAGQLYRFNTNPEIATGDGVALAYRAGAQIQDVEFFQFHPTALRLRDAPPFLISEAVRGEGGILRNQEWHRFMADHHPDAELAPRDVVARGILWEMQKSDADHVLLDVTHLPPSFVSARFPSIYRFCLERGLDISKTPIPVAPAAHYLMGGIRVNAWGRTSIPGLFACGEAACTGVHGANRLASNSLLEVLIFGKRIMERAQEPTTPDPFPPPVEPAVALDPPAPQAGVERPNLADLQQLMWEKVGIVRSRESLEEAKTTLSAWADTLAEPRDRSSWELSNCLLLGRLITEAALRREESRGAHFRADFPYQSDDWRRHIVFQHGA